MDTILDAARFALRDLSGRTADLVRSLPSAAVPVPGSAWTVRDTAVHLMHNGTLYAEIAAGMPSPLHAVDPDACAEFNGAYIADIGETDPAKLADLVGDAVDRLLDATAGRPGELGVPYHLGITLDLARLVCVSVGEHVLHGLDIATALGVPWPIDPAHAALVLYGYAPLFGEILDPDTTAGHTAAYGIDMRGAGQFTVRFTDGAYALEEAGGSVDCTISAQPVAFLLVGSGRMSQWTAMALGLLEFGGDRADLGPGFAQLFRYP